MANLKPYFSKTLREAGCDEAGRGCLAGPVVAAAVILPEGWNHPLLNDSKLLSHTERESLGAILENELEHWAVAYVDHKEIDRINILNASFLAMHRAVDQLIQRPDLLLIDGNRFNPYPEIAHACIIKGDSKYRSIAAASILAKTHRDRFMAELDRDYPAYNWAQNKGYPTKAHRVAIAQHGASAHHRLSFRLLPKVGSFQGG